MPITTALLLDRLAFLNGHGFEIVEFGRNFFRVEGVPGVDGSGRRRGVPARSAGRVAGGAA